VESVGRSHYLVTGSGLERTDATVGTSVKCSRCKQPGGGDQNNFQSCRIRINMFKLTLIAAFCIILLSWHLGLLNWVTGGYFEAYFGPPWVIFIGSFKRAASWWWVDLVPGLSPGNDGVRRFGGGKVWYCSWVFFPLVYVLDMVYLLLWSISVGAVGGTLRSFRRIWARNWTYAGLDQTTPDRADFFRRADRDYLLRPLDNPISWPRMDNTPLEPVQVDSFGDARSHHSGDSENGQEIGIEYQTSQSVPAAEPQVLLQTRVSAVRTGGRSSDDV